MARVDARLWPRSLCDTIVARDNNLIKCSGDVLRVRNCTKLSPVSPTQHRSVPGDLLPLTKTAGIHEYVK